MLLIRTVVLKYEAFYGLRDKNCNAYSMYHVDYIDIVEVPVYVIAVFLDTVGELNGHNKYLPLHILNKYP